MGTTENACDSAPLEARVSCPRCAGEERDGWYCPKCVGELHSWILALAGEKQTLTEQRDRWYGAALQQAGIEGERDRYRRALEAVLEWHEHPTFKDICGYIRGVLCVVGS